MKSSASPIKLPAFGSSSQFYHLLYQLLLVVMLQQPWLLPVFSNPDIPITYAALHCMKTEKQKEIETPSYSSRWQDSVKSINSKHAEIWKSKCSCRLNMDSC
jgi:hypothetical protein